MKKGMNILVSLVLLIVFSVTLGLIVSQWSGKLLKESIKSEETRIGTELECMNVKIKLEPFIENKLVVKNNGDKSLYGFIGKITTTESIFIDYQHKAQNLHSFETKIYNYKQGNKDKNDEPLTIIGDIQKIDIIPKINIGDNRKIEIVDCTNKIVTFKF